MAGARQARERSTTRRFGGAKTRFACGGVTTIGVALRPGVALVDVGDRDASLAALALLAPVVARAPPIGGRAARLSRMAAAGRDLGSAAARGAQIVGHRCDGPGDTPGGAPARGRRATPTLP